MATGGNGKDYWVIELGGESVTVTRSSAKSLVLLKCYDSARGATACVMTIDQAKKVSEALTKTADSISEDVGEN